MVERFLDALHAATRDPDHALALVRWVALVGILLSTLEHCANWRLFRNGGLFDWRVIGSRGELAGRTSLAALADRVLGFRGYIAVLGVRVLAILSLFLRPDVHGVEALGLTLLLATTLLVNFRSPMGQDGSDQMATIIVVSLWINLFAVWDPRITPACLWFVALQSCLSYCVSGIAKLMGKTWREGDAVYHIFNTESYGLAPVATFLRAHPLIRVGATWTTMAMETLFPLVLILPMPLGTVFLAWGLLFHLANAVVMGLNSFLWSFAATYPAILYCASAWRS